MMSNMAELYYHIGLMKTGSTFLQTRVFPLLEQATFAGHGISGHRRLMSFKKLKKVVISNETTVGVWFKDVDQNTNYLQRFKIGVENVSELFRDVRLIVVFREPSSFLYSSYKQYLHQGGTRSWERFYEELVPDKEVFLFSRYIQYLTNKFSREKLLMLNFDRLKENPVEFGKEILEFIGENPIRLSEEAQVKRKSNPAIADKYEGYLIHVNKNKWFYDKLNLLFALGKADGRRFKVQFIPRFLLPRVFGQGKKRDLGFLKEYYERDWKRCCAMIEAHSRRP